MLEFFIRTEDDAINILKKDHEKVKDLFNKFEKSEDRREKKKIAAEAIKELKIHTLIEEEIFYPIVRGQVEDGLMNEAEEEHHVAKLIIAEIEQMKLSDDQFDAKFKVLAENVRHHIREEEGKMFPEARSSDMEFGILGEALTARKQELMEKGLPPSEEKQKVSPRSRSSATARKSKQPTQSRNSKAAKTSYSSGTHNSVRRKNTAVNSNSSRKPTRRTRG